MTGAFRHVDRLVVDDDGSDRTAGDDDMVLVGLFVFDRWIRQAGDAGGRHRVRAGNVAASRSHCDNRDEANVSMGVISGCW